MHVLSAQQFGPEELDQLFREADEFREMDRDWAARRELASKYLGLQVCALFYQPSTRTRVSSEAAAHRLGFGVISSENAGEFSSVSKGETIEDTVRVLGEYGFASIMLRTSEIGMATKAADAIDTVEEPWKRPAVINCGDGTGEHPTQAMLDAYTILREHGRLSNLRIVLGGDLKHGRTVRSLSQTLAHYDNNHLIFVSMPELQIGSDIKIILDENRDTHNITYEETSDMHEALREADVIYWTRLQKEYLEDESAIPSGGFIIDKSVLETIHRQNASIMHPLPRIDEIHTAVDQDPRAKYFGQAGNGLFIRMALLDRAGRLAVEHFGDPVGV